MEKTEKITFDMLGDDVINVINSKADIKKTKNLSIAENGVYFLNGLTVTVTNNSHFKLSGIPTVNTLIKIPINPVLLNGTYAEHIENVEYIDSSENTYGTVSLRNDNGAISGSGVRFASASGTFTTGSEITATIISVYVAAEKPAEWEFDYQLEQGDTPTKYIVPEVLDVPLADGSVTANKLSADVQQILFSNSVLSNKSIYCDGDSIAYGLGSGGKSYCDIIADKYNMSMTKTPKSGTTLAVREGRADSILERIKQTQGHFDYILIDGGINDIANNIPMGELTGENWSGTFDETTVIGALESICQQLCTKWFEAKKLFVLVHKRYWYWSDCEGTRTTQQELFSALKSVLKKWGIPYVDIAAQTNLVGINEEIRNKYFLIDSNTGTGDGLHPTFEVYKKFYVPLIEAKLKTL